MHGKMVKMQVDEEEIKMTKKLMEDMELKKLIREERLIKAVSNKDSSSEKQQKVINALTNERDNLVSNLSVMQTERRCLVDNLQAQEVNELFGQGDSLDMEIAQEKKYIADLEAQIRKESMQQLDRRDIKSNIVSDFRQGEEVQRADRVQESLKSRLHAEQVQLSLKIKDNAALRKRIELLLKSKTHFNQLFEELMQKLNKGKKIMVDIVAQSKAQFKKRDEVVRKIEALKERDEADLQKRQEEMQDLEMRVNEDSRISRFKHQVAHVRTKLSEGPRATKKANLQRQEEVERLRALADTWERLQQESGFDEGEEICDLLVKQEAENFSLFNYNNELRYQLEALTEGTAALLRKVDEEQEVAMEWDQEQQRAKHVLGETLTDLEENVNDTNDQCEDNQRQFDRLLAKTKVLFDMVKCDPWPLEQLLGENQDVTQFNYRLYLRLVEDELVNLMGYLPPRHRVPQFVKESAMSHVSRTVISRCTLGRVCSRCEDLKKRT